MSGFASQVVAGSGAGPVTLLASSADLCGVDLQQRAHRPEPEGGCLPPPSGVLPPATFPTFCVFSSPPNFRCPHSAAKL